MTLTLYLKHIFRLTGVRNYDVFFFSQYFDYVTGILISRLSRNNNIFFIDIFKPELKITPPTLAQKIFIKGFYQLFRLKLYYTLIGTTPAYFFKLPEGTKSLKIETNIPVQYKQRYGDTSKKNILLFEGRGDLQAYFTNYNFEFSTLLDSLLKDYHVYIKPHPRLGTLDSLKKNKSNNLHLLKKEIPAEFISANSFDLILGIETTAIVDFSLINNSTYSIIDLFSFVEGSQEFFKDHLNKCSNGNLKYTTSIEELNRTVSLL
jgi:hypothetical protein